MTTGRCLAVACLAAAGAASSGCWRLETPAEAGIRTQTLLVGNYGEPSDLDPGSSVSFTDAHIDYALFEGLTKLDSRTSMPAPAAADHWDVSGDGRIYTFHIREDARWSNGDPLTAEDFVYAFRRVLTPTFAAAYSYMLWPIKNAESYNAGRITDFALVGVRALDAHRLQLTLEGPTPYLPALASLSTWMPVHRPVIEKFGAMDQKGTPWTKPGNIVSNGAFSLVEWRPNARLAVVKNPMYWDAANTRLSRIEFFPIDKEATEELAYRSGQLHVTFALPTEKIAAYRAHIPSDLMVDPVLGTSFLFINVNRPPLDNRKVRQALSHAINRILISRNVTQGAYLPARSFVPPACNGYTSRSALTDDFDEARRLLADAGYPGGKGLPPIELQTFTTDASLRTAEAVQSMWHKELGVNVTIGQYDQKTVFQNGQSGSYALSISAWIADYPDPLSFLGTMVTGGGNNWSGWSNKEFDQLVADASKSVDNAVRLELFQRAEAILLEDAPLVPIYYLSKVYALSPAVRGWTTTQVGFHEFNRVWLEK